MAGQFDRGYLLALAVSLGLAAAYAVHRDLPAQYRFYLKNEEYARSLKEQYESLVREEKRLTEQVNGLERDPIAMEASVRQARQLARPGERLYRVELEPEGSRIEE